jgi:hypothetical protein
MGGGATVSPEKQRIAIAEVCGWSKADAKRGYTLSQFTEQVPDYLNDLNAMHEAEDELSGNQYMVYALMLDAVEGSLFGIRATARQRAEAFLRTLGKWEPVVKHPFTTDGDHLGDVNKMVGEVQP